MSTRRVFFAVTSTIMLYFGITYAQLPTVVYDPSAAADRNIQSLADRVHRAFTENKWIENVRILYQNYTASKNFYDTMTELSRHRGGLVGHWQARLESRLDKTKESFLWRVEGHIKSDPADTAYVKNWMREMDKRVIDALDYSKEIRELGKKEDKRVDEKLKEMTTPNPVTNKVSSESYDSAKLTAAMEQIRQLRLMNDYLAMLLRRQEIKDKEEWEAERRRRIEAEKIAKEHSGAYSRLREQRLGSKRDPKEVLWEIPR